MALKDKLGSLARSAASRAGKRAFAAFNRADELGGELRDYLQERVDSPALRKISERLARVRGPKDTKLFDQKVRAAQAEAIAAAANAAPPPTAAEVAAAKHTGLGNPALAAQVYGRASCPWTGRAMTLLNNARLDYDFIDLEDLDNAVYESRLVAETKQNTTPYVYLRGEFLGGFNALDEVVRLGQLEQRTLAPEQRATAAPPATAIARREHTDEVAPGELADRAAHHPEPVPAEPV
jgi:glutaredoxin